MAGVRLRDLLQHFLEGSSDVFYPVIETRIIKTNPLQVTDDGENVLDLGNLQEAVQAKIIEQGEDADYKLVLNEWNFIFKKVPNTHDFYFDITAQDFRVLKDLSPIGASGEMNKIADDEDIR